MTANDSEPAATEVPSDGVDPPAETVESGAGDCVEGGVGNGVEGGPGDSVEGGPGDPKNNAPNGDTVPPHQTDAETTPSTETQSKEVGSEPAKPSSGDNSPSVGGTPTGKRTGRRRNKFKTSTTPQN